MLEISAEVVQSWRALGSAGLGMLALAYIAGGLVFVPRPALCFVSGLVFGFIAVPVAMIGSTIGAVLAFLLSRYLFQSYFLRKLQQRSVLNAVIDAIEVEGWRIICLLRLASPIPAIATNYLLGVTRIRLWPYTIATFIGQLPQILLFVYLGTIGQMMLENASPLRLSVGAAGLALAAIAISLVTRRTRAVLAARMPENAPSHRPAV